MKTVLFDFDGVIADSLDYAFNWFSFAANKFDVDLPFDDPAGFKASFIEPFPEFYKFAGFDWDNEKDAIYEAYVGYHAAHPVGLVDGIEEVISELGSDPEVKLGIVSSNDQNVLDHNLTHHGLAGYFDVVIGVTKDLSIPLKPDPTSLLMALSRLGSSPGESVYIGDQPSDILAARNAE
ncbi:MAG: HAD family hydrolase, partial [Desulfobacterales bacterium]|nr:HAD family hydrolase [Desulfobacterales bacterium]